jgi:hypothetical protein
VKAVTGVFISEADAQRAVKNLRAAGAAEDKVTLLTSSRGLKQPEPVAMDTTERPGIGKAMGAVVGAAGGLTGGSLLAAAILPGVGPVTALGLLGSALLGAAGATVGAKVAGSFENFTSEGLPEDEIFVYEDALRRGRSVVIALGADDAEAARLRDVLKAEGAEEIDAARHQWWIGLRSAEREHYETARDDSPDDEKFYRMGFEAALHARMRCKEFDQVSAEMANQVEELERQYPKAKVEGPFTRGYQRGREYYQRLCDESRAA